MAENYKTENCKRLIMYHYKDFRSDVFKEENQVTFLKIRDKVNSLLKEAGAVTMGSILNHVTGDSWINMACVDRLVELKEIIEVKQLNCLNSQHRIFIKG